MSNELVKISDVREDLLRYMKTGGHKRYYLGHSLLDKHYGVREASRTDWSGYPASGKTELLIECLWNCSNYYDHKHLIYMPDAGSVNEVVAKLFFKITGKRLERFYWDQTGRKESNNVATEAELDRHLPEILHYFKILNVQQPITPTEFWLYAEKHKEELGIFDAVIDSWNYMKHDLGDLREDKWLAKTLQTGNDIVERSGLHFHTIIHPRSARLKDGKLMPPTYHELKGGSEWGNYAKGVIIVHRDKDSNATEVHIEKAKGTNVGIQGMITMQYDIQRGRYFTYSLQHGAGVKSYAAPENETNTEVLQSSQSSLGFGNITNGDDPF